VALDRLGLQKTTLVDYPGEVAATLFTSGCNLSCPYCHNPELISGPPPDDFLSREEVLSYLEKRSRVLGAVCITGGEPTLHGDLPDLVAEIHELGLKVKVDTNGTMPDRLESLGADYYAMDVKTAPGHYDRVGLPDAAPRIRRSMRLLRALPAAHEFRTTVVPGIVDDGDVRDICEELEPEDTYTIAQFRPLVTLDPGYRSVAPYPIEHLEALRSLCAERGITVSLRSA
jgi:pyruvate formate lyase activating enzyme